MAVVSSVLEVYSTVVLTQTCSQVTVGDTTEVRDRAKRQTRTRALVLPTRECRCCELERGVLCEPHAASTLAHQHSCARCRSVHAACVACGGAGGVCEASNWVYERVRMCTDRKGGRGSGAYQPTSAVTPHTSLASVELLAPKQGYTR